MEAVRRPIRTLWRTLGSRSLAAVLLGALLLATALAGIVPQAPGQAAARGLWLEAAALRYGRATGLLDALGLFDAFHAPWYLALLAALLLSTLVCTVQRALRLWRSPAGPAGGSRLEAAQQVASLLSHLAAVALVAAVALRPALLAEESGVRLLPGQAHAFGPDRHLAVRAGSLTVQADPAGQPRDYSVPLALLVEGTPVVTETVRLNRPATFHGTAFHLQGFGPAAEVLAPGGTSAVALAGDRTHEVDLPGVRARLRLAVQPEGSGLFVEALDTSEAGPVSLGSGLVRDGEQIQVWGLPVTLRLTDYTVWQIGRDPTFGVAVGAAGLLLVAVLASLGSRWALTRQRRPAPAQAEAPGPAAAPAAQGDPVAGRGSTAGRGASAAAAAAASLGTWFCAALAVVLAGLLAGQGLRAASWPLSTEREVALAFALATALAAAAIGAAAPARGAATARSLTFGLALGLAAYAWLGASSVGQEGSRGAAPLLRSIWFPLHAGAALLAYGALAAAGAAGAAWLLRLPERHAAQRLMVRAVAAGYPLLTLSMLLGMVWGQAAWGRYWTWDLKEAWTLAVWLLYTFYWHVRHRPAWQGRRLARLAVAGLLSVFFLFLGADWLARAVALASLRPF